MPSDQDNDIRWLTSIYAQARIERDCIERLMPALDVLCLSSAWGEAFPNVLGEAMACEVPCVTTDIGDAATVVGPTGWTVPTGDAGSLAEALHEALHRAEEEARSELGAAARRRIQENFSQDAIVARYAGGYERLAASK